MAAPADSRFPHSSVRFVNLPNFRLLCAKTISTANAQQGMLYRSSRPDFLDTEEVTGIKDLGVKCVLDFRSGSEYVRANGSKLLDNEYCLCEIKPPRGRKYRSEEPVRLQAVREEDMWGSVMNLLRRRLPWWFGQSDSEDDHDVDAEQAVCDAGVQSAPFKHILINFFPTDYVQTVFWRAPLHIRLYALFVGLMDIVLKTGFQYFLRIFARHILNPTGLIGQYKDISQLSHRSICAALRLMTEPDNLPMLINCAHGKDRTGIVSAMVLTCLGKSKDYICAEYALSAAGTREIYPRMKEEVVERFHMSEEFLTASYATMESLLNHLADNYGSVENYMESIGFSQKEQAALRVALTGSDQLQPS